MRLHDLTPTLKLLAVALLALGAGCSTSYRVKVDALSKPNAEKSIAYILKTSNPDIDTESLRHKEAENFVKTALSGKGLYEAPKAAAADMIVSLEYDISPPKTTRELRYEPIYKTVTVPGVIQYEPTGASGKDGAPVYREVRVGGGTTDQLVGYREVFDTVTVYDKHLRISARENKPTSQGVPPADLWTVDVTTTGESRDLRKALPVLAAATIEFVGKDTRGEKSIKLKDKPDGSIAFVKKGM